MTELATGIFPATISALTSSISALNEKGTVALIVVSIVAMDLLVWVVVGGVVVLLVVTFAYSYVVWRDDPNRQTGLSAEPPSVRSAESTEPRDTP